MELDRICQKKVECMRAFAAVDTVCVWVGRLGGGEICLFVCSLHLYAE